MKKPYLNSEQRQLIYADTTSGAFLLVDLRFKQTEMLVGKTKMMKLQKSLVEMLNNHLKID